MTTRTRQRISVSLTAIAVVLWTHSILHATLEIGHFGLIHGLPVTFFVAFAFLTVASALLWVSPERHGKLLFLQLALLISGLWLVPAITGGSPPFTDHAYRNLGMIEYVVRNGHFDGVVIWYQSWPGAFILSAAAAEISSINFEPALPLFPYLMQLLYLLPLYVFLHNTLGQARGNYIWAGAWLFSLGNWIGQNYFGPSGVALFLLLTLLALVTSTSMWQRNSGSLILLCLAVLVFAALAMTHLLTSLAALCILAALCLVKRSKYLAMGIALCLVLAVCWDLIGAHGYIVNRFLPGPAGETAPSAVLSIDPGVVGEREVTGHFTGSESHVAVALTRVPFSAIFALIGVAGVFLTQEVQHR
jgi:hypothetical protein